MRRLWALLSLVLVVSGACGNSDSEAQRDRNASANISAEGCTSSELQTATTAWSDALTLSTDANSYFAAGKSGLRYTTWFGAFDSARWNRAKAGVEKIHAVLSNGPIGLHCNQSGCSPSAYGYTFPADTKARVIYVCEAFFAAPRLGTDSRAGTLIHLLSQFTDLAGTESYAFGTDAAKSLAVTQPQFSVKNSDNFEYFFENTPAIIEPTPTTSTPATTISLPPISATESTSATLATTTSPAPTTSSSTAPSTTSTVATSAMPGTTTTNEVPTEPISDIVVKRTPALSATTSRKASVLRIVVNHLEESGPRRLTIERRRSGKWEPLAPSFEATTAKSVRLIDVRAGSYRVVLAASGDFAAEVSGILVVRR